MAPHDKDLENGDPNAEASNSSGTELDDLDEYTALQKYITTYRDPKDAQAENAAKADASDVKKSHPWWQFWRRGSSSKAQPGKDPGAVPDSWLDVDIKQGIQSNLVAERRKQFGWNEIATEKENMFKKFLGYFMGPILYGTFADHVRFALL